MAQGPGWAETSVTIAESGNTSTAIDFRGYRLFALKLPVMTSATMVVHACDTYGGTYVAVVDDAGTPISITATDSSFVGCDSIAGSLAALPFIKLVAAGAEAAERVISVFLTR